MTIDKFNTDVFTFRTSHTLDEYDVRVRHSAAPRLRARATYHLRAAGRAAGAAPKAPPAADVRTANARAEAGARTAPLAEDARTAADIRTAGAAEDTVAAWRAVGRFASAGRRGRREVAGRAGAAVAGTDGMESRARARPQAVRGAGQRPRGRHPCRRAPCPCRRRPGPCPGLLGLLPYVLK